MTRARIASIAAAPLAAALVALSTQLPLWSMTMKAPQYPRGLHLYAYGTRLAGDVSEINILNHYIGMPPIEAPALETALFPAGIAALTLLCLLSALHPWLRRLAIFATTAVPVTMLADLQWRLYAFGHSLNPKAPIRLEPFTPLVIGETAMGNFVSTGMPSWGVGCIVAAALVLFWGGRLRNRWTQGRAPAARIHPAIAALFVLAFLVPAARASDLPAGVLQARIDAAPAGSTLLVPAAIYR